MNKFRGIKTQAQIVQNIARKQATQNLATPVNVSFPGQNMGLTREEVEASEIAGLKVVGVTYVAAAGTVNPQIELLSTAMELVGIAFFQAGAINTDTFNLLINGTNIVKNAAVAAYSLRAGAPANNAYFPLRRIVGGNNSIELAHTSAAGGTTYILNLYYR